MDAQTREQLATVIWSGRHDWVRLATRYGASNPRPSQMMGPGEYAQAIDTFIAVALSELRGEGGSLLVDFIDSLFSGLVSDRSAGRLLFGTVTASFAMVREMAARLPEPVRPEATAWLASFFGRLIAELSLVVRRETAPRHEHPPGHLVLTYSAPRALSLAYSVR